MKSKWSKDTWADYNGSGDSGMSYRLQHNGAKTR